MALLKNEDRLGLPPFDVQSGGVIATLTADISSNSHREDGRKGFRSGRTHKQAKDHLVQHNNLGF